jgi:hypothetical protein
MRRTATRLQINARLLSGALREFAQIFARHSSHLLSHRPLQYFLRRALEAPLVRAVVVDISFFVLPYL